MNKSSALVTLSSNDSAVQAWNDLAEIPEANIRTGEFMKITTNMNILEGAVADDPFLAKNAYLKVMWQWGAASSGFLAIITATLGLKYIRSASFLKRKAVQDRIRTSASRNKLIEAYTRALADLDQISVENTSNAAMALAAKARVKKRNVNNFNKAVETMNLTALAQLNKQNNATVNEVVSTSRQLARMPAPRTYGAAGARQLAAQSQKRYDKTFNLILSSTRLLINGILALSWAIVVMTSVVEEYGKLGCSIRDLAQMRMLFDRFLYLVGSGLPIMNSALSGLVVNSSEVLFGKLTTLQSSGVNAVSTFILSAPVFPGKLHLGQVVTEGLIGRVELLNEQVRDFILTMTGKRGGKVLLYMTSESTNNGPKWLANIIGSQAAKTFNPATIASAAYTAYGGSIQSQKAMGRKTRDLVEAATDGLANYIKTFTLLAGLTMVGFGHVTRAMAVADPAGVSMVPRTIRERGLLGTAAYMAGDGPVSTAVRTVRNAARSVVGGTPRITNGRNNNNAPGSPVSNNGGNNNRQLASINNR
tara:strand:+ start:2150 stop:3748 length:1599 start_codon:yes stop_codon:yes gene_type:complete